MKQKNITVLLALFLGSIGAHKFYLGQWKWGVGYILFSWTGIPLILGIIESILYFRMSEQEFSSTYTSSNQPADTSHTSTTNPSQNPLHKKPENLSDVVAGLKATWQDPESRKKILKKVFRKNIGDL